MKLSQLKKNPDNPRLIRDANFERLKKSIAEFGAVMMPLRPIVYDSDNVIIGGNMRLSACLALGMKDVPDDWVKFAGDLTDEQKREFVIKDNSGFGEYDWDLLSTWDDLPLAEWGVDIPADWAGEDEGGNEGLTDADEVPDNAPTRCKAGDLWACGQHRVLCGDSTKAADVARLMGGEKASLLFYDPPWDMELKKPDLGYRSILVFSDGRRARQSIEMFGAPTWVFVWDCVSSWYTPNRPLQRHKLAFWYGDVGSYDFDGAHYGDAGEVRNIANTRGSYQFVPDPRGKHLSDLFSLAITKLHSESEHSHSKPSDWVRMLIANCSDGAVYDPFLGSGTALIAAEQTGRKCFGIEISEKYCDVVLARWEAFTGKTAELITDGND